MPLEEPPPQREALPLSGRPSGRKAVAGEPLEALLKADESCLRGFELASSPLPASPSGWVAVQEEVQERLPCNQRRWRRGRQHCLERCLRSQLLRQPRGLFASRTGASRRWRLSEGMDKVWPTDEGVVLSREVASKPANTTMIIMEIFTYIISITM